MIDDVWVEVSLDALKNNFEEVKKSVGSNVDVAAVVKANGYGHGYIEPSKAFIDSGAKMLCVTRIDEALKIRDAGIDSPILILAPILSENIESAIKNNLELTVTSAELANCISEAAVRMSKTARIHLKVDIGMGRFGVEPQVLMWLAENVKSLPGIEVAGVMSHFSSSAEKKLETSIKQLEAFSTLIRTLKEYNINYGKAHVANSAAILRIPDSHFDMVRTGTLLYGQYPSKSCPNNLEVKNTWRLKGRICDVKTIQTGHGVGYGQEFKTKRVTKVGIVPIGYAEGISLAPTSPIYRQSIIKFAWSKLKQKNVVTINEKQAEVLGRIAMQAMIIDITDIPGVEIGAEVVIPAMRIPTNSQIKRIYLESFV